MSRGAFSDGGGRDRERNRLTRAINVTGERLGEGRQGDEISELLVRTISDGRAEDLPRLGEGHASRDLLIRSFVFPGQPRVSSTDQAIAIS